MLVVISVLVWWIRSVRLRVRVGMMVGSFTTFSSNNFWQYCSRRETALVPSPSDSSMDVPISMAQSWQSASTSRKSLLAWASSKVSIRERISVLTFFLIGVLYYAFSKMTNKIG